MVGRSFGERELDWRSRAGVRAVYTDTRLTSSPLDAPANSVSKARGNNLVALGSAAVLIVYTAGFAKTKPAADRMAAESAERRPRSASRAGAGAVGARTVAGESGESSVPATPAVAVVEASAAASVPSNSSVVATPAGLATAPASSNVAVAESPATSATVSTPAGATPSASSPVATVETAPLPMVSAPVTAPVVALPAAAPSAPAPAQTVPAPVSTPAAAAPPAAPPATAAAKPAAKTTYKDGVYLGRGTSRHGDIEAMVEIQGGRITNAVISQCLTRYSCSWIAVLVPQVVARQSAEVDYVSGATVSSDAFYYAVTQALAQAK